MSIIDLSGVETSKPGAIKPGKYVATITEAKVEPLYSGKGKKLSTTIKIVDGDYKNRNIYHNFNIQHENKDAERIGKEQLKGLMQCLNLGDVLKSTDDLCGKPFLVVTKLEMDKETGAEKTRVRYFEQTDYTASDDDMIIPF